MNVLLVGDRRFIPNEKNKWYTEGPRGAETGERYLKYFDQVTVVGRETRLDGRSPDDLNRVDAAGLTVVTLPNLSGLRAQLSNRWQVRARLKSLISMHDAVILRMPTQLGLEAFYLARSGGKPLAADLGGCTADGLSAHGSFKARLYAPISFNLVRSAISQIDWVSYVTQNFLQQRYPAAPGANTIACPNVEIPPADNAVLHRRFKRFIDEECAIIFGTIGSLHGQFKGIQHALSALAKVKELLPNFKYRILGGGDQIAWRELVRKKGLEGHVFFDGTLPSGPHVRRWLDGVDVYLQPSLREGVPRALIEAMSRGCPAIASNIAGIPELLEPEFLHKPSDVDRLSEIILKISPKEVRRRASTLNFEKARGYAADKLKPIRDQFWQAFAVSCDSK